MRPKKWLLLLLIPVACLAIGFAIGAARERLPAASSTPPAPDTVVLSCGEREVTNTTLGYYYWSEYYYYINSGAQPQPDPNEDLSQQRYDQTMSWHEYFCQAAIRTAREDLALALRGTEAGFTLPEEWAGDLRTVKERFREFAAAGGYTLENGQADLEGYLRASYGASATEESFFRYLQDSYYAAAYADALFYSYTPSDEAVEAYFLARAEEYETLGYAWDEASPVTAYLIHFPIEGSGTQARDRAKAEAEAFSLSWHAAGGDENGLLRAAEQLGLSAPEPRYLSPHDELEAALWDWCFHPLRQVGDGAIVQLQRGYTFVFFSAKDARNLAYSKALEDMRYETYRTAYKELVQSYSFRVSSEKIVIAAPPRDEK